MLPPPAQPMAVHLHPDGVVKLHIGAPVLPPGTYPHTPGTTLLPGQDQLEQDVVWVFPAMASTPLTVATARRQARISWDFMFGVAMHREIIARVPLTGEWTSHLDAVLHGVVDLPLLIGSPKVDYNQPTVKVVAGLETHVDTLGPTSIAMAQAAHWMYRVEYELAQRHGAAAISCAADHVRYSTPEEFAEQENSFLALRAEQLSHVYLSAAYDIAAMWRGQPTLAQHSAAEQRKLRNQQLINGVVSTSKAFAAARNNRALRQQARAAGRADAALTDYRRARSQQIRRRLW